MVPLRLMVPRLAAAALAAGVAAVLALGGAAAPAAAAPVNLLVSTNGVNFSSALKGGMFDGLGLLVPGHSITTSLWIKNPTSAPAALRVSARDVVITSSSFAGGVTLSAWNSGTGGTLSEPLGAMANCDTLVPSQLIAAGATMKMVVTVRMGDLTGITGQNGSAKLGIMVAMRGAEAGPFPASACEDKGVLLQSNAVRTSVARTRSLPNTGADLPVPLLIAAGVLVGAGFFFVAGRRRREREES